MKKGIWLLAVLAMLISLTACTGTHNRSASAVMSTVTVEYGTTWPEADYLKEVPSLTNDVALADKPSEKVNRIRINTITYDEFKAYIAKLEQAGFKESFKRLPDTDENESKIIGFRGDTDTVSVEAYWYSQAFSNAGGTVLSRVQITFTDMSGAATTVSQG